MDNKLEMIETVSKLYRDNLKYAEGLRIEKDKIKDTMQNQNQKLTHVEYVNLERRLKYLEDGYTEQMYKTQGISLAREALLDL